MITIDLGILFNIRIALQDYLVESSSRFYPNALL